MKILVTGGAGFMGSHVAERLLRDGHRVAVVDNLSTGFAENVPPDATLCRADIRDEYMTEVFERERPDAVCHHAAQLDVRVSMIDPLFDADVNIRGSLRLMDLCVRHGVRKFVFASTGGAIYGEDRIPASEKDMPRPVSGYGVAKLSVEQYLHCFHVNYGLVYTALRYANVYGPRQNAHGEAGVVAIFCDRLLTGTPATLYGDGGQTRDFVYVSDVVEANALAMNSDVVGSFNIGTGRETDINRLYGILAELAGVVDPPCYGPAKPGEQRRSVLDCTLARETFGWSPQVSLDAGLEKTMTFFRDREKETRK
ncbi:MAG: NAD-dependent epimerase/dehydratase family protein [candidate division Zixibacteria bacterium]|nr:NAD-dependent epimerase/dehydratase family protein [candidate division Zixibacteria bacterium]